MTFFPPTPPPPVDVDAALRLDEVWPKLLVKDGPLYLLRDRVVARFQVEAADEPPYDTFVGLGHGYPASIERESSPTGPRYRHWYTAMGRDDDENTSEVLVARGGRVAQVAGLSNLERVVVVDSFAKAQGRVNTPDAARHPRMHRPIPAAQVLAEIAQEAREVPDGEASPMIIFYGAEPRTWFTIAADPTVDDLLLQRVALSATWLPLVRVLARNPNLRPESVYHLSHLAPWDVAANPSLPLLRLSLGTGWWETLDERARTAFDQWSEAGLL